MVTLARCVSGVCLRFVFRACRRCSSLGLWSGVWAGLPVSCGGERAPCLLCWSSGVPVASDWWRVGCPYVLGVSRRPRVPRGRLRAVSRALCGFGVVLAFGPCLSPAAGLVCRAAASLLGFCACRLCGFVVCVGRWLVDRSERWPRVAPRPCVGLRVRSRAAVRVQRLLASLFRGVCCVIWVVVRRGSVLVGRPDVAGFARVVA